MMEAPSPLTQSHDRHGKPALMLPVNQCCPLESVVQAASEALGAGEVVVGPTETRYALMVRADSPSALDRLFNLKGRSDNHPSAIFLPDFEKVREYAICGKPAEGLAREFLPGPLTLILPARLDLGKYITPNGKIGLRISASLFVRALALRTGLPITATSANISGGKELETVAEIYDQFGDGVAVYCDAGQLCGATSTVVDACEQAPQVVRRGAISEDAILRVWKDTTQ